MPATALVLVLQLATNAGAITLATITEVLALDATGVIASFACNDDGTAENVVVNFVLD